MKPPSRWEIALVTVAVLVDIAWLVVATRMAESWLRDRTGSIPPKPTQENRE